MQFYILLYGYIVVESRIHPKKIEHDFSTTNRYTQTRTHIKRISKMSTTTEWQTVMGKKSQAKTTNSYVPPHLRAQLAAKAAEEKANRPLDIKDEEQFPTFGRSIKSKIPEPTTPEPEKEKTGVSFKQTIHNLIALENRTEWEKLQAEEERKAMEGFARLPLKVNREWFHNFNRKVILAQEREKEIEYLQEIGCWVLPPNEHVYGAYPEDDEEYIDEDD